MVLPKSFAQLLLKIVNRAPPEVLTEFPLLRILRIWVYLCLQMLDKAEAESREVIAVLESAASEENMPPESRIVTKGLAYSHLLLGYAGFVRCTFTRNYDYVDDFKRAAEYAAFSAFPIKADIAVQSLFVYLCRVSNPERGEMERFIASMDQMLPYMGALLDGCGTGMDDLARGELAYFRGELAASEEFLLRAMKKSRQKNQYEIQARSYFYLTRLYLNRGDYEKLQTLRAQGDEDFDKSSFINDKLYFDLAAGWFYAQIGQPIRIASWLKNEFEESDLNFVLYGLEMMVKAKFHYAIREYPAALAVLKSGDILYGPASYVMGKIEINILKAACYYKMGKKEECFSHLEEAWDLAKPNDFIMPFTEMSRDMRSMATAAEEWGKTSIPRKYLERIRLSASAYTKRVSIIEKNYFPTGKKETGQDAHNLSRRELEVLQSLFQGLTGEEIAQEIRVSINTVKSTIKQIYYKLGALNRSEAIRTALEMGLLKKQGR
jgi:LuxR family maltose regulon positive regulatory protein